MHTLSEFRFDLMKLGGQPLLRGGATNPKLSSPVHSTRVGKTEDMFYKTCLGICVLWAYVVESVGTPGGVSGRLC